MKAFLTVIGSIVALIMFSFLTYTLAFFYTLPPERRTLSMHTNPMPRFLIAIFLFACLFADFLFVKKILETVGLL